MTVPAALAAVPLLVGAAVGAWAPLPVGGVRAALAAVWALAVLAVARGAPASRVGVLLGVGFALGGAALAAAHRAAALDTPLRAWFDRQPEAAGIGRVGPVRLEGRLRRDARATDYGAAFELAVSRVGPAGGMVPATGGVRLSVGGELWAGRIREWREGRRVRVSATLRPIPAFHNPGSADQARRQALRGTALRGSVKSGLLVDVTAPAPRRAELAASARAVVRRAVVRTVGRHGEQSAAIVTAILIGDREGLDPATTRRLQDGGIYHVIAISGGNIAILTGCLLFLGRLSGLRPRSRLAVVVVCVLGYSALVGDEASVTRATAAAVIVLGARLLDHRTPPLNVLAATAAGVGLASPLAVLDPGFLLTFGATLGIVLGAARVTAALWRGGDRPPAWAAAPLALFAATLCAEAVLLPIGAALFGRVSLAGLVLNFAAIPLMTLTQVAGLVSVALLAVHPVPAAAAGYAAHLAATGLVESTRLLDVWPWLVFRVPPPAPLTLVTYYAALLALLWRGRSPRTRALGQAVVAVTVRVDRVHAVAPSPRRAPAPRLDAGERARCRSGRRHAGADPRRGGGPRRCRRVDQPAVRHREPRRRAGPVVSGRPEAGRGGADAWPSRSRGRSAGGVARPAGQGGVGGRAGLRSSGSRGAAAGGRRGGRALAAGRGRGPVRARGRVVRGAPSAGPRLGAGAGAERRLDRARRAVRGRRGAAAGDIGRDVEPRLAGALAPVPFRVVKVPHHGSAGSSSRRLVSAARACVAVVSADRANPFGHPAPAVTARYREAGAMVLETGRDGAVVLETDGRQVDLWTAGGRRWRYDAGGERCAARAVSGRTGPATR